MRRDWWKTFFGKETGELMFGHFVPGKARREVDYILRMTGARPGERILDLGCGIGRHSVEFARRGFDVVGLDYSRVYLVQAAHARSTLRAPSRLRLVCADMRHLDRQLEPESIDLVLSAFNSFGYFDKRSDDLRVLRQIAHVLRPGGSLLMNTISRSGVERALGTSSTQSWMEFKPGAFLLDRSSYDPKRARFEVQWLVVRPGRRKIQRFAFEQNVYFREELARLLGGLGLRVERLWGSLDGSQPLGPESWDQTFVARKADGKYRPRSVRRQVRREGRSPRRASPSRKGRIHR